MYVEGNYIKYVFSETDFLRPSIAKKAYPLQGLEMLRRTHSTADRVLPKIRDVGYIEASVHTSIRERVDRSMNNT